MSSAPQIAFLWFYGGSSKEQSGSLSQRSQRVQHNNDIHEFVAKRVFCIIVPTSKHQENACGFPQQRCCRGVGGDGAGTQCLVCPIQFLSGPWPLQYMATWPREQQHTHFLVLVSLVVDECFAAIVARHAHRRLLHPPPIPQSHMHLQHMSPNCFITPVCCRPCNRLGTTCTKPTTTLQWKHTRPYCAIFTLSGAGTDDANNKSWSEPRH
jgi:hypothetical protein